MLERLPNIQDEIMTIKFIVKGMRGGFNYKQLARDRISIPPTNLSALKAVQTVQDPFEARPETDPTPQHYYRKRVRTMTYSEYVIIMTKSPVTI